MSILDFPSDPTELTEKQLSFLFQDGGFARANPGAEVAEVTAEVLAADSAFLGRLAHIEVTWSDDKIELPNSFVVKMPTLDPGGRAVGEMLNVWAREAHFYDRLAPLITTPVPSCRANFLEDQKAILILDFLDGANPGDQIAGASPDQARAAVEALAQLHAPFWGERRPPGLEWVPGIDGPGVVEGLARAIETSLPNFLSRFGNLLPNQTLDWLDQFVPLLSSWRSDVLSKPLTITHADYRLANMLFEQTGKVTIIDWQTAMFSGGATDLSFFVATNLEINLRRELESELIQLYSDTLVDCGVSAAATKSVQDDYAKAHLWWMGMLANNLSSIETPDEVSRTLFEAMLTRLFTAALDADSGRFLEGW